MWLGIYWAILQPVLHFGDYVVPSYDQLLIMFKRCATVAQVFETVVSRHNRNPGTVDLEGGVNLHMDLPLTTLAKIDMHFFGCSDMPRRIRNTVHRCREIDISIFWS